MFLFFFILIQKLKTITSSEDMALMKRSVSEAKIVKLNTLSKSRAAINRRLIDCSSPFGSDGQSNTSDSDFSISSEESANITKEMNTELYVVRDFQGDNMYGDLCVQQGEILRLICESNTFFFVANQYGQQGYIPIDVAVDMIEVMQRAKRKTTNHNAKITSV
jgi:hypothetical protein